MGTIFSVLKSCYQLEIVILQRERRRPPQPYIDEAQRMTVSQPIGARSPNRESITPPGVRRCPRADGQLG